MAAPVSFLEVSQSGGGGQTDGGGLLEPECMKMRLRVPRGQRQGLSCGATALGHAPSQPRPRPPPAQCGVDGVCTGNAPHSPPGPSRPPRAFVGPLTTLPVVSWKKPMGWFGGFLICKMEIAETFFLGGLGDEGENTGRCLMWELYYYYLLFVLFLSWSRTV